MALPHLQYLVVGACCLVVAVFGANLETKKKNKKHIQCFDTKLKNCVTVF